MGLQSRLSLIVGLMWVSAMASSGPITVAGQPAEIRIRASGDHSLRVTLAPLSFEGVFPFSPGVAERPYPAPALVLRSLSNPIRKKIGALSVEVRAAPLTIVVTNSAGKRVQEIAFQADGRMTFALDNQPVLGLGEGGPKPERDANWRELPVQFDRSGAFDSMEPRWQSDAYGSRNPVATLVGTGGWALFIATPWVQVDLTGKTHGVLIPRAPNANDFVEQDQRNQGQANSKGIPPAKAYVPGLFDVFVIDAHDPAAFMKDYSVITGPAALPPKWALGYMQSHRMLEDDAQLLRIVDTFRTKQIPLDAVIYLGTGFTPRGWNTPQPSFDFNPEVFKREPRTVLADLHARNVKVVLHMVPWDRDKLPALQGTIPPRPGEALDDTHILKYWKQHENLVRAGVDAFWPDEGDWFNLFERIKRHQMYYQGSLLTTPNVRPWSLHRNGYPGIAQWDGWVWSGDTESSWKTLEAQIAVGINYSLSTGPYWGSDIGGFYPNAEFTGELYARWFQFASFVPSFRAHGKTWWTRLPWGWGSGTLGPIESDESRNILQSELNNPTIEPIAKTYAQLHYRLLPYEYTLAYEARATGMPLMRALWLHYPDDPMARGLGSQYLWGRDLLVAPVFKKGATSRTLYLPKGEWYDWWTHARQAGGRMVTRPVDLATMPIYVRAGAIIPVDPVRQFTAQPVTEPTTLEVFGGSNGQFTLYDDDGISQDYLQNKGAWIRMTWNDSARTLRLAPGAPRGATDFATPRAFRVRLLPAGIERVVQYLGKPLTIRF
jgi:alpha-glucosidase (family GH31 glycosyl hydrolase)